MKIEPKFNIGDIVYYRDLNNRPSVDEFIYTKCKIINIYIDISVHKEIKIEYNLKVLDDSCTCRYAGMMEKDLYRDKEGGQNAYRNKI